MLRYNIKCCRNKFQSFLSILCKFWVNLKGGAVDDYWFASFHKNYLNCKLNAFKEENSCFQNALGLL
jgi:hypothetical protein